MGLFLLWIRLSTCTHAQLTQEYMFTPKFMQSRNQMGFSTSIATMMSMLSLIFSSDSALSAVAFVSGSVLLSAQVICVGILGAVWDFYSFYFAGARPVIAWMKSRIGWKNELYQILLCLYLYLLLLKN